MSKVAEARKAAQDPSVLSRHVVSFILPEGMVCHKRMFGDGEHNAIVDKATRETLHVLPNARVSTKQNQVVLEATIEWLGSEGYQLD